MNGRVLMPSIYTTIVGVFMNLEVGIKWGGGKFVDLKVASTYTTNFLQVLSILFF
jgi:hypothetical protein